MKFTLSNLIAFSSILVWATAWAATENKVPNLQPSAKGVVGTNIVLISKVAHKNR